MEIRAKTVHLAWLYNKAVTSASVFQVGKVKAVKSTLTTVLRGHVSWALTAPI